VTANYTYFSDVGDCYGGRDTVLTVENNKITLYVWGPDDPSGQCE